MSILHVHLCFRLLLGCYFDYHVRSVVTLRIRHAHCLTGLR